MPATIIKAGGDFYILFGKQCDMLKSRYSELRRGVLFATPFLVAGLLLILLAITYGFVLTLRLLLDAVPPAETNLVITPFFHFVLLGIFFIMFCLTLEKAWPEFHNLTGLKASSSASQGTPVLLVFRFIRTVCFSTSSLLSLTLFGVAPLVALGLVVDAPWHYYLFILPVLCLFLAFPASLGVIVLLLLSKLLPAKRMVQLAGGVNFFLGFILLVVFIFGIGAVLPPLLARLETAGPTLSFILPLNVAAAALEHLLHAEASSIFALGGLVLCSIAFFAGTVFLTPKLYHWRYSRKQVKKPSIRNIRPKIFSGTKSNLIFTDWQESFSDGNMAVGVGAFVVIAAIIYLFIAGRFLPQYPAWHGLILVGHTGVVGFLAYMIVGTLRVPASVKNQDTSQSAIEEACKEQELRLYKMYEAASLSNVETVWWKWVAFALPAAILGGVGLLLANIVIGGDAMTILLALAALLFLLGSFLALDQWMELVIYSKGKGALVNYILPYAYYVFGLGILALGQSYQHIGFLRFMHHLPQETVNIVSGAVFICLTVFVFFYSLRMSARTWKEIKI